jgi:hypothetical protein
MKHRPMKKVLLIIIDALTSRLLVPAMNMGKLPNIRALANAGALNPECSAIFPSLTPAATASIITGYYPQVHNLLCYHWYDMETNEVIYYGDDFWVILNQGIGKFFEELLIKLNHQRLKSETLFQRVERAGLKAASLNYLVYRGDARHKANLPLLFGLLPGAPFSEELFGPSLMYFGDLVETPVEGQSLKRIGGLFNRFGFVDDNTAHLLLQLAEQRALPDFTVAYFPDNDHHSHQVGPEEALPVLKHVDSRLGDLFRAYGGLKKMLSEFCIIITGDHAQSDMIADEETANIKLDQLLADFAIAPAGKSWQADDQLMICPDMRTAQIYFQNINPAQLEHVAALLLADSRVDQLIWTAEYSGSGEKGYYVATLDRGRLRFWPSADGVNTAVDHYGCPWSWVGNLATVGGEVLADGTLIFHNYPNAFERIVGALDCKNSGHLWLTARPGCEFSIKETNIHAGGGSHGSLHALDSLSPLLVAGAPEEIQLPLHPRTVDIAPLCMEVLGLKPPHPVGASRVMPHYHALVG